MPVLQMEPYVWPETIFSEDAEPGSQDASSCWWALHTRPRAEKAIARRLLSQNVPFFLPLYDRKRQQQRKTVTSYLPLFPSYVFIRGTRTERLKALETNLVVNCLTVPEYDQQQLWVDLQRFYDLMKTGASMYPEERMHLGTSVRITSGPLKNYCGKISRRRNKLNLFVELNFLQRSASVEIHESMIEPV